MLREFQRPVECRIAAAEHDDVFPVVCARVLDPIEHVPVDERVDAVDAQWHRLKRADTPGDDDGFAAQFRAGAR